MIAVPPAGFGAGAPCPRRRAVQTARTLPEFSTILHWLSMPTAGVAINGRWAEWADCEDCASDQRAGMAVNFALSGVCRYGPACGGWIAALPKARRPAAVGTWSSAWSAELNGGGSRMW